jgi:hypothetical protein
MPTKTTAKKQSTKKAPTSKKTPSTKASSSKKSDGNFKAMVCAADGECFWTRDGRILQNMADLHMAFGSMDDEVFLHHVSKEKNDFANWVEYVLQDLDCAVELRKVKKKAQAEKIVAKYVKGYGL